MNITNTGRPRKIRPQESDGVKPKKQMVGGAAVFDKFIPSKSDEKSKTRELMESLNFIKKGASAAGNAVRKSMNTDTGNALEKTILELGDFIKLSTQFGATQFYHNQKEKIIGNVLITLGIREKKNYSMSQYTPEILQEARKLENEIQTIRDHKTMDPLKKKERLEEIFLEVFEISKYMHSILPDISETQIDYRDPIFELVATFTHLMHFTRKTILNRV